MRIYGVDFTCAPRRAKPITVAVGSLHNQILVVQAVERLQSFGEFEALLARPGPWVGGFDFPFSLPRELVRDLRWPSGWKDLVRHCASMSRQQFRAVLDAIATRARSAAATHIARRTFPRARRAR